MFGLEPVVTQQEGYQEVVSAVGARSPAGGRQPASLKTLSDADHVGKGWTPHVPSAILETNDIDVYAAFVRGLFEADGTVLAGVPCAVDGIRPVSLRRSVR